MAFLTMEVGTLCRRVGRFALPALFFLGLCGFAVPLDVFLDPPRVAPRSPAPVPKTCPQCVVHYGDTTPRSDIAARDMRHVRKVLIEAPACQPLPGSGRLTRRQLATIPRPHTEQSMTAQFAQLLLSPTLPAARFHLRTRAIAVHSGA